MYREAWRDEPAASHVKLTHMAETTIPTQAAPPTSPPSQAPVPAPAMDVVAPPVNQPAPPPPAANKPETPAPVPLQTVKPKPAKQSVTTAIIATVIIVLGLAALAVYAYIKQKG